MLPAGAQPDQVCPLHPSYWPMGKHKLLPKVPSAGICPVQEHSRGGTLQVMTSYALSLCPPWGPYTHTPSHVCRPGATLTTHHLVQPPQRKGLQPSLSPSVYATSRQVGATRQEHLRASPPGPYRQAMWPRVTAPPQGHLLRSWVRPTFSLGLRSSSVKQGVVLAKCFSNRRVHQNHLGA